MSRELRKVLLVDDDPDLQIIIKLCLKSIPQLEFYSALSGEEALKLLEQSVPDMILLDVMMPKMDGIATLERIRQSPACSQIPVVFITATAQVEQIASYTKLGLAGVITKPFDPCTLDQELVRIWNAWQEIDTK